MVKSQMSVFNEVYILQTQLFVRKPILLEIVENESIKTEVLSLLLQL